VKVYVPLVDPTVVEVGETLFVPDPSAAKAVPLIIGIVIANEKIFTTKLMIFLFFLPILYL
jgi:hypothetical protein